MLFRWLHSIPNTVSFLALKFGGWSSAYGLYRFLTSRRVKSTLFLIEYAWIHTGLTRWTLQGHSGVAIHDEAPLPGLSAVVIHFAGTTSILPVSSPSPCPKHARASRRALLSQHPQYTQHSWSHQQLRYQASHKASSETFMFCGRRWHSFEETMILIPKIRTSRSKSGGSRLPPREPSKGISWISCSCGFLVIVCLVLSCSFFSNFWCSS